MDNTTEYRCCDGSLTTLAGEPEAVDKYNISAMEQLMADGYCVVLARCSEEGGVPCLKHHDVAEWHVPRDVPKMLLEEPFRYSWDMRETGQTRVADVLRHTQRYNDISKNCKFVSNKVYGISTRPGAPDVGKIHTDYSDASWSHVRRSEGERPGKVMCKHMPVTAIWGPLKSFDVAVFDLEVQCRTCRGKSSRDTPFCDKCPCTRVHVPENHVIFLAPWAWHAGGPHTSMWMRYHGYCIPTSMAHVLNRKEVYD